MTWAHDKKLNKNTHTHTQSTQKSFLGVIVKKDIEDNKWINRLYNYGFIRSSSISSIVIFIIRVQKNWL